MTQTELRTLHPGLSDLLDAEFPTLVHCPCGAWFPDDEMIRVGSQILCADCAPEAIQRERDLAYVDWFQDGQLARGMELREVEVEVIADFESGKVREIRQDTYEAIKERPLRDDERQPGLPIAETPAPVEGELPLTEPALDAEAPVPAAPEASPETPLADPTV